MRNKTRFPIFLILLFSLVLAACGAAEPTPEPEPTPTEAVMEEDEVMEEENEATMEEDETMEDEGEMAESMATIAEIAIDNGSFDTLVAALTAAGLAETFSDPAAGPFTVLAPTDDAFAALPDGLLDTLLADPNGALTTVLTYHVIEGKVPAETVVTLDGATTLGGEDIMIAVVDGNVVINDVATVVTTDIEGSNGIIHVIDAVIVPPSMADAVAMDDEMMSDDDMDGEMMEDAGTIAEVATDAGSFGTLLAALDAAGLAGTFADADAGPFTVFAPTDDAFAALPEGTVEALLEDPEGALTNILTYHVVEGEVLAEAVVTLDSAATLNGADVSIAVVDGGVVLNDSINVVTTDIKTSNGVIHVIDAVLLPPTDDAMMDDDSMMEEMGTIAAVASEAGSFETLLAALGAAGLAETFADADAGPFTVFAPTDDAFAALPEGTVEALLEDPEGALTDILTYHVVEGEVLAETVVTLESATTLNGADVSIAVVDGGVVLNDSVNVVTTDIKTSNGVIHVIDAVLLPPTDDEMMEDDSMMEDAGSIAEIAAEAGSFETLLTALGAAGLAETFADAGAGPFTVFAPTDDAFAALPEGTVEALLEDPEGALTDILTYHVVEGAVLAETVVTLESATTLNGKDVTIEVTEDGVMLNGTVNVVTTDIKASNGVIHVIDMVLLPPEGDDAMMEEDAMVDEASMDDLGTIAEVATANGSFTTLLAALDAAGLAETFADKEAGPFTVFAPTDDAFAALPEGTVASLLEDPTGLLTTILTYHVVEGVVKAETVVTLDSATTLQGEDIHISIDGDHVILNDTVNVIITDIETSNGVIHVIDMVLIPPSAQ